MVTSLIHDLPVTERPREKFARLGPSALDHAELLALFIRTGTRGRSAIQIGRDLLQKHGSLSAVASLPVSVMVGEKGLGKAKAVQLAAAFEIGTRVVREAVSKVDLDSPMTIHELFAPQLVHLSQEKLLVVLVDCRLRHESTHEISTGTVSEVFANTRDILRPVIAAGAYGFILIHNHPSGDPTPSRADETFTRSLHEAANLMQIRLVDHVILGRPGRSREPWYSFREAGIVE